jgi:hypothetical protein
VGSTLGKVLLWFEFPLDYNLSEAAPHSWYASRTTSSWASLKEKGSYITYTKRILDLTDEGDISNNLGINVARCHDRHILLISIAPYDQ